MLSKLLGLVLQPVNFVVLVGIAGLLLYATRVLRHGRRLAALAALSLAVLAFSPMGTLLLRPLEDRFPRPSADMPPPTGIIVLGGAMDEDVSAARGTPTLTIAAARLTAGAALARRYPSAQLVFTGGSADLRQKGLDEARGVRDLWLSLGIPAGRMQFENESRNTFENAEMTRALVAPNPDDVWLLVTSAAHMPRSVGIFRRVGWPVVPYPVDYRTFGDWRDFKPSAIALDALEKLNIAVHEWIGLLAYRLTGKTGSLFPKP